MDDDYDFLCYPVLYFMRRSEEAKAENTYLIYFTVMYLDE